MLRLIIVIAALNLGIISSTCADTVQDGLLNLTAWEPDAQPIKTLSGQWQFFPNQLVTPATLSQQQNQAVPIAVPAPWNALVTEPGIFSNGHGIGTYWLTIDGAATNQAMSLRMARVCSNANIYFFPSGQPTAEPLAQMGRTSSSAASSVPYAGARIIPLNIVNNRPHHLLIQVSNFNFRAGGICGEIQLGKPETLAKLNSSKTIELAMFIAMFVMAGVYSLAIYTQRRQNRAPLWLMLACFSLALFYFSIGGVLEALTEPSATWTYELRYKIALNALCWAPVLVLLFYNRTFPGYMSARVLKYNLYLSSIGSLFFTLVSARLSTPLVFIMISYVILQFLIGLWVLGCAIKDKRPYAKPMTLAVLPIILVAPGDIHNYISHNAVPMMVLYSLLFFLIVESQIIGMKFANAFKIAERLSNNLKEEVALQTAALHKQNSKLEQAQKALKFANSELKKLSITDGLTGVYNRIHFETEFRKEWRRCARQNMSMSILMIDTDHFKKLNDTAGHLAGDHCLRAIARQLNGQFKRAGELVARYGGEEFVVMLPDTDQQKALAVAEDVRAAIEQLIINYDGTPHTVTVSIGVSTTRPSSYITADNLLATADAALYEAKRQGRNRVGFIPLLSSGRRNSNKKS